MDENALETSLKQIDRPQLLMISTQVFFLSLHKARRARARSNSAQQDASLKNPLLRCGLLLSGSNLATSILGDDGILTGLEILGMRLTGTRLVVLSSCETALGDVQAAEGMAGLCQAFHLAGAQRVVATLWQILSRDSALLMNEFYANWSSGLSESHAMQAAQIEQIEKLRKKHDSAHPFFWAAWTITGGR